LSAELLKSYVHVASKVENNPTILANISKACMVLGQKANDPQEKITHFDKALEVDKGQNEARLELAYIHMGQGNF
jgi:Tfp pilus assembly protein PilF